MRITLTLLVVVVNFILQTTIYNWLSIGGIVPNTTLILVVSYALLRGKKEGALIGLFTGILFDIFLGTHFCFYAILYAGIGYLIGRNQPEFYRENYILPIVFCIFATVLFEFVHFAEHTLFQTAGSFVYFLFQITLPMAVYTAVCTMPIYRLLFGLDEWLISKERYKHRLF